MPRRNSPRSDNLRRALAQEAARLMAEHGIHDFGTAKRKAAERLGVGTEAALPRNTEIEASLAEYQRLFAAGTHETTLNARCAQARLATATYSRCVGPVYSWRGRPMRIAGSEIISSQCATQPTVRAIANITVYIERGMFSAL